jgi:hypothetical protein
MESTTARRRIVRRLPMWTATIAAVVTALAAGLAAPAQAAPTVYWRALIVNADYEDQCLSANFSYTVFTADCGNGSDYHVWQFTADSELVNDGTTDCLSGNPSRNIYTVALRTCVTSLTWHQWYWGPLSDGTYQFYNDSTHLCLSTNGTSVYGTDCDASHRSQHWYMVKL